jgi:DNA-binding transcriptional LysR family regulator
MIRHARMALSNLARAHEDIVALKSGMAGQVDVGSIMTPALGLLPRAITRVKRQVPQLRIGVQIESSNELLERLQRGTLDFLLARITGSRTAPTCSTKSWRRSRWWPWRGSGTRWPGAAGSLCTTWCRHPGLRRRRAASCASASTSYSTTLAWNRQATWSIPARSC